MKKILKGLTALAICGALNIGLTTDAQAAEKDFSTELSGTESQEFVGHHPRYGPPPPPPDYGPPPRHDNWRHDPPPRHDYWRNDPPPRHDPPPPPPHRW